MALDVEAIRRAAGGGALLVQVCRDCGHAEFPPAANRCPRCLGSSLDRQERAAAGTIHSFTVMHRSFPSFEVPLTIAFADFGSDLRLMGHVIGIEPSDVRIGAAVAVVDDDDAPVLEGGPRVGYAFQIEGQAS